MAYKLTITNKRPDLDPSRVTHAGKDKVYRCLLCQHEETATNKPRVCPECHCGKMVEVKK